MAGQTQEQMDLNWGWILVYVFMLHPNFLKCGVSEQEINVPYDLSIVYLSLGLKVTS